MAERVLIVDDDPVARRLVENMVSRAGYEPVTAEGGDLALAILTGGKTRIDCVVLDLVMPDLDGLGVLAKMGEAGLEVPVIVQTAHGGIDNVVSAMRAGAVDFVVKPVGAERLQVSLRNALATRALEGELKRIKHSRSGTLTFKDIVTRSARMLTVLRTAEKAAASSIAVLIEGESGVGKELIARAIHGSGERRAKPFVTVNCGAIPENLVESALFGHEKGAFTGAAERHAGKFVDASGGTLFLDEIGELPLPAPVKLLRALRAAATACGLVHCPALACPRASQPPPAPHSGPRARPAGNASPGQPFVLQPADHSAAQPGNLNNLPIGAMLPLLDAAGDVLALEAIEAAAIRFAIAHYRGQMSEVARKLRIGRSTLYRKIEHLGLAEGPGEADVPGR